MKRILKKTLRPFYYFFIDTKTKLSFWFRLNIVKHFLPRSYCEELTFFEGIRSQTYQDQEYLSKRTRMFTHWVDKTFTLSKKINKATTAKRVTMMIQEMEKDRESDRITCQWANQVLNYYSGTQKEQIKQDLTLPIHANETLSHIIKTRRSIRSYKPQPIEDNVLFQILDAGLWAPSGCNRQAVEYLIVDDSEDVLFCQKYAGEFFTFPQEAAVNIVILIDPRGYAMPHQRHMAYLEGGASIQNILLTAHSLGLGSCWMFWEKHDQDFNKRFSLSPWLLPVGLVCVGYTDQQPPIVPKRKSVFDCFYDRRATCSSNTEDSHVRDTDEKI